MSKELKTSQLVWKYKDLTLELTPSRLRWKATNSKNQVIASGVSLNGIKLEKKDVESKMVENAHFKVYQPVIS